MPQVDARFRCCALQIKTIKRFSKYPADDNMALAVPVRVYRSTNCVNAIFCGKHPAPALVRKLFRWASGTSDVFPDGMLGGKRIPEWRRETGGRFQMDCRCPSL